VPRDGEWNDEHPDPSFWGTSEGLRRAQGQRERSQRRARVRRHRLVVLIAVAGVVAFAVAFVGFRLVFAATGKTPAPIAVGPALSPSPKASAGSETPQAKTAVITKPTTSSTAESGGQNAGGSATKPHIVQDLIPFGPTRRQEMAAYSLRHYGQATIVLRPHVIVIHFTAGPSYESAHSVFVQDVPNTGELPGVVSHFVIDKDGTIYQQLPTDLRGRHAIGLNQVAIGIEFVQETGSSSSWADQQILHRSAQTDAGLRLVAWLQRVYGISDANVIGHAMANQSPYFEDLEGWRNDHTDWLAPDVARFRADLRAFQP
jgi:hypothetical protein